VRNFIHSMRVASSGVLILMARGSDGGISCVFKLDWRRSSDFRISNTLFHFGANARGFLAMVRGRTVHIKPLCSVLPVLSNSIDCAVSSTSGSGRCCRHFAAAICGHLFKRMRSCATCWSMTHNRRRRRDKLS
jgi:hypothetical protein